MLIAVVSLAGCLGQAGRLTADAHCVDGYQCTGAGDVDADGCYTSTGNGEYVMNAEFALYSEGGVWRVGHRGVGVSYVAKAPSTSPPLASEDWQCGDGPAPGYPHGIDGAPCPGPSLVGTPAPGPAPALPGSSLYPVPTTAADRAVDCAVRSSAWHFAQYIQPWRGAHVPVFDALELFSRCNVTRPTASARQQPTLAVAPGGSTVAYYADARIGRDTASGSDSAPFATIGRGVQACRSSASGKPCTLYLSDAAPFVLNTTLALTSADSHLTIMPRPGTKTAPVITAAATLALAHWVPVNTSSGQNIWKTVLPDSVVSSKPAVYIHGKRGMLARWPNVDDPATAQVPIGYAAPIDWLPPKPRPPAELLPQPSAARPEDITFPDWTWARATAGSPPTFSPPEGYWLAPNPKGGDTYAVPSGVSYSAEPGGFSERAGEWREPTTGHVHAFHGQYWGNWIFEILAHDRSNRTIHFGAGGSQEARGSKTGGGFFVENIKEELDHPFEYFVDRFSNELFLFYPASAGTPPPPEAVTVALVRGKIFGLL